MSKCMAAVTKVVAVDFTFRNKSTTMVLVVICSSAAMQMLHR